MLFDFTSIKIKSLISKAFFCLAFFFILGNTIYAQKPTKEEKKLLKKARKELANENFKSAQAYYLSLLKLNPKSDIYNFEGGLSYYFSDFEREKSVTLFESALTNSIEDTIPELYYYLARAYHFSGEFKKSEEAFEKLKPFIYKKTGPGKALLKQSNYYISLNNNAQNLTSNNSIKVENLGDKVNSSYGEYATVYGNTPHVILFTSRRPGNNSKTDKDLLPYEDIYVAKKNDEHWVLVNDQNEIEKYIPKRLNTKGHDASILYSEDGKTLYTYKKDIIWKSILEDGKWSDLVELDKNINNSQYNIPSISLSSDGNTIFFVSTKKDGYGAKDIYKSSKGSDGKWSEMENLGANINTEFDEDSPFITSDGKTLYFSSKGHKGIGGYDIFKSQLNDGEWSIPENIGIPLNSPVDDIYYIMDSEGKSGYLSSNRNGGLGGMDLYSFCTECPSEFNSIIKGLIVDESGNPVNDATVSFVSTNSNSINNTTANNGSYEISTKEVGELEITISAQNFEPQKSNIILPNKSSNLSIDFELKKFTSTEGTHFQILTVNSKVLNISKSDTIKLGEIIASSSDSSTTPISKELSETFYFDYNNKEVNANDINLSKLIKESIYYIDNKYHLIINIESSASRVPTSSFQSNNKLAEARGLTAKKLVTEILSNKGINMEKVTFNKVTSGVSGPSYKQDATNMSKYKPHQFVKITVIAKPSK